MRALLTLSLLFATTSFAQEPTSLVALSPSSAPALSASMEEAPPQRPKPAANALLLASVSGKLVGLSFNALNLRDIISLNDPDTDPFTFFRPVLFARMPYVGWGFAAVMGGAAYVVDDSAVKPWMFYTELATYGSIGLGLGAAALHAGLSEDGDPENVTPLAVRSGAFLSAGIAAGIAAHLLKKSRAEAP